MISVICEAYIYYAAFEKMHSLFCFSRFSVRTWPHRNEYFPCRVKVVLGHVSSESHQTFIIS